MKRDIEGFSLIEVMIAAFLLLIVFFGLAQIHARGRGQLVYEEDRRKASAVLEARMDGLRRDYGYDTLIALDGVDTTFVSDGKPYVVSHQVSMDTPQANAAQVTLGVTWVANVSGTPVSRSMSATTILARGMP